MGNLFKNFVWMAAANIVSSLFGIVLFLYLARTLMPEAFGYLSYAMTIVFFLANFIDLGLSTYGIREVAKDRTRVSDYVSEIVSFRFLVSIILGTAFALVIFLSACETPLKAVMLGSALMLVAFGLATEWAYQGVEKMQMVFISFLTTLTLQLGLMYIFVKKPPDVIKVPIIYFISTLPILTVFLRSLKFRLKIKITDLRRIAFYLSSSLIIWSISMFAQIYNNLDILILGLFKSAKEVGYFTIARRVTGGFAFLLVFLANAALPRLSRTFCEDRAQFRTVTQRFLWLAVFLTICVFSPLMIFSKTFISLAFGSSYLPADLPLKIMMGGLILVTFNLPYSTGLIASGFEKEVLKQTATCASFSIVLNFILIPRYGIIGASVAFLCTETLALAWIMCVYWNRIRTCMKNQKIGG